MIHASEQTSSTSEEGTDLTVEEIPVWDLMILSDVEIPEYQRPYKWKHKHVAQLMDDIEYFSFNSDPYRLGNVVIHSENGEHKIVDGQQRYLTLSMILMALPEEILTTLPDEDLENLNKKLDSLSLPDNQISRENIRSNYQLIRQRIGTFTQETVRFLRYNCTVIRFSLNNISTAFQFFDSQNARGKALDPHDLLKAFHLRSFAERDKPNMDDVIAEWEGCNTEELRDLFKWSLFPVRRWRQGNNAPSFEAADVDEFKGINLHEESIPPYAQFLRVTEVYIRQYNDSRDRFIDCQRMNYPFTLDMTIGNGRLFFEMVGHYLARTKTLVNEVNTALEENQDSNEKALEIMKLVEEIHDEHRIGDRYVQRLFLTTLLQYVDKFGMSEIARFIEHLFIWTFGIRLNKQRLGIPTIDNRAASNEGYPRVIDSAKLPHDVLRHPLPSPIDVRYDKSGSKDPAARTKDIFQKHFPFALN